jgi:hypothetical protein
MLSQLELLDDAGLEDRIHDLREALQRTAQNEAPQPFVYRDIRNIFSTDSRPAGFIARYAVEGDEAKVVFLVLDMGHSAQRRAAKALEGRNAQQKHGSKGGPEFPPIWVDSA